MHRKLCLAFLVVLCACESVIEVDIDSQYSSQLVVDGAFRADSSWVIRLTKSIPFGSSFDDVDIAIENATLQLSDSQGYSEFLAHIDAGFYISPSGYRPAAGVNYYLRAEAASLPEVAASSTIPLAQVEIVDATASSNGESHLRFAIKDTPGKHYFRLVLWQLTQRPDDDPERVRLRFNSNNRILREYIDQVGDASVFNTDRDFRRAFFSDELFEDGTIELAITHQGDGDMFELELVLMSQAFFGYQRSLARHGRFGGGFESRPTPVYSNVESGLGVFAGYDVLTLPFGHGGGQ